MQEKLNLKNCLRNIKIKYEPNTKLNMEVNGKSYPLWGQFVEKKQEWIGGWIEDFGDRIDKIIFDGEIMKTVITDVILRPNGNSAYFEVVGKEFSCGFGVEYGGIIGGEPDGKNWITFSGYGGHQWRIMKRDEDS